MKTQTLAIPKTTVKKLEMYCAAKMLYHGEKISKVQAVVLAVDRLDIDTEKKGEK